MSPVTINKVNMNRPQQQIPRTCENCILKFFSSDSLKYTNLKIINYTAQVGAHQT